MDSANSLRETSLFWMKLFFVDTLKWKNETIFRGRRECIFFSSNLITSIYVKRVMLIFQQNPINQRQLPGSPERNVEGMLYVKTLSKWWWPEVDVKILEKLTRLLCLNMPFPSSMVHGIYCSKSVIQYTVPKIWYAEFAVDQFQ